MVNAIEQEEWTMEIKANPGWFDIDLKELWRYRDLIALFVRRDFISLYKQTILGPIWHLAEPLITAITYTFIFGRVANLSSDGLPRILFYLSGIILWYYFSNNLTKVSSTFVSNSNIFGKVYFPRLTVPISIVISNTVSFGIKFLLFLCFVLYYVFQGTVIEVNQHLFLVPVLVLLVAALGLGLGIIVSALTAKYRDLKLLINFSIRLLMFATPIIYPLSSVSEKYRWILELNPMTAIVETFRYAFFSTGVFSVGSLAYSAVFAFLALIIGMLIFNRTAKTFMDTV